MDDKTKDVLIKFQSIEIDKLKGVQQENLRLLEEIKKLKSDLEICKKQ